MAAAVTGVRASAVEPFAPEVAVESARELYERHGAAILRFCRSRLRTREEAEDAGQTTFLYAFRALSKGVVPVSELSWLLKIAENVCKTRRHDARRRFAVEVSEDPEQLGRIAAPARAEPDLLIPLGDALSRLTESQRHALLLREWHGLSYREIAERMGIGQGAVEVLLFRARRAVAEELETPGKVRRKAARALDFGWLAGLAKQFLGGGVAAKAALAALAVGVVATVSTVSVAVGSDSPPRPAEPSRQDRSAPAAPPAQVPVVPGVAPAKPKAVAAARADRPRDQAPRTEGRVAPARTDAARPAPERVESGAAPADKPADAPRRTTVDDVTGTVSSTVEPVVGMVQSTVEPVVGPVQDLVEDVVEDVVETAEPVVPPLPDPGVPDLPDPPQLP